MRVTGVCPQLSGSFVVSYRLCIRPCQLLANVIDYGFVLTHPTLLCAKGI